MTTTPDGDAVRKFKGDKGSTAVTQVGFKCGWASTKDEAIDHTHRLWPNAGLPGELSQVLPSPQHFEQASSLVTREMTAASTAFGDDPADHVAAYQPFIEAGFDEIYAAGMGPHYAEMITSYRTDVLPELRGAESISASDDAGEPG